MKKLLYLLIIIIIASCSSQSNEFQYKRVTIAGKIINPDPMTYKINLSINHIGLGQERLSKILNDDGSFKFSFESNVPTDVWLSCKTNFLILTHPGDSIYVEFEGSKEERTEIMKTIKFSGNSASINNEAAAFQNLYFSSNIYTDFEKKRQAITKYDEVRYKHYRDSLKDEELHLLKRFENNYKPSSEIKDWAKIYLETEYFRDLIAYPEFHRMANNLKSTDWNVPISYYSFLNTHFAFNNSNLINGYSLSAFVNFYPVFLSEKIRDENKKYFISIDTIKKYQEQIDSIELFGTIKYTEDPLLRQMVLTEMLRQKLEQSNTRIFEKYLSTIESYILEPYLKEPLFNLYNKTIERLDNPKLASEAILKKLNGTSLKSDIDSIINSNKGKVLYMDCWATWCGPCISEMPNSKRVIDEYKSKDVAFIFICLDSEERNWKSIISKYSLEGQHFLLSKNQSNDFREVFGIKGIPHYILIDKKGIISENGTAPPSAIKDNLDKLLN